MRTAVHAAAALVLVAGLAGCIADRSIQAPPILDHERLQLELERDQAVHKLDVLKKSEKGGGGTTHREIMEQELKLIDFDWKLGRLPYNTYHTRRLNKLKDIREYERPRLERGWTSRLDFDRLDLHVQRERMLIGEIERVTYEAQKEAFRDRLAAAATRGARNDAAAAAQVDRALVQFDAEMREW